MPQLWRCCATTKAADRGLILSTMPRVSGLVCLALGGVGTQQFVASATMLRPQLPSMAEPSQAQAICMAGAGS